LAITTRQISTLITTLASLVLLGLTCSANAQECPADEGIALQVLGSGGPIADDARAGSAYVVWIDGRSSLLIDAGSGTFLRFAESGANFTDLDLVGLSHFHVDHTSDFPALLKSGNFSGRSRALIVTGPGGSDRFPGLGDFMHSLLDPESGAFAYLGGYLDGLGRLPKLALFEIHDLNTDPVTVLGDADSDYQVSALTISHGIVPALAYSVRVKGKKIVIAGDQDGRASERLANFASDAEILVLHMPIAETTTDSATQLHALPSLLGELAADANADTVIVSHLMSRSLKNLEANLAALKSSYNGNVQVASDLACYTISQE
jgi:ribonuclease BN (tRNA processing enzyme)